jgi:hypothetical protein
VAAAATAGVGTAALFWLGQWDGVIAMALAIGYGAVRGKRAGKSGAWLTVGLALVKPHLAIGTTVAALGLRNLRFIISALVTALSITIVSIAAVGPTTAWNFIGALLFESGHTPPQSTLGIYGLMTSWPTGKSVIPYVVLASLGVLAICFYLGTALWQHPEIALAGTLAFSLAVSPHTLPHDLVLLAPIFVAVVAKQLGTKHLLTVIFLWLLLNLASLLDMGNGAIGAPGRLVPWVLIAIGVASYVAITRLLAPRPATPRQPE